MNLRRHHDPKVVMVSIVLLWGNERYRLPEAIALTLRGPLACCWRCNGVQEAQEGEIPSRRVLSYPRLAKASLAKPEQV